MRKSLAAIALASVAAVAAPARAQQDAGFSAAVRVAYGLPMGGLSSATGDDLSNLFSSEMPLWLDVGYRFKGLFVGGYFQYGLGFINKDRISGCKISNVSCSGYVIRLGVEGIYNFMPEAPFMPWAGLGLGYEVARFNVESLGVSGGLTVKGFEFLNLQFGGDFKVSPVFSVGPYLALSVGQYSTVTIDVPGQPSQSGDINNTAVHEWLQFGLKGTFNL